MHTLDKTSLRNMPPAPLSLGIAQDTKPVSGAPALEARQA